jgi:AraC-like DNA-binding protein
MSVPKTILPSAHSRIEQRADLFESIYSVLCGGLSIDKLNYANIVLGHYLASFLYIDLSSDSATAVKHAEGMVSRVTHFMSENIESNLTLREIASFAGYSESFFYRKFIKETGHAPIDYFIHMKINKASIYLIKTQMTIAQIAAKLGFNSADYFSRTFRRIVGITATEFRREGFRL